MAMIWNETEKTHQNRQNRIFLIAQLLSNPYPVCMDEVLQFVGDQDHSPFIILQKLEDSFLHQVITEVDVQRRERIVL